MPAPAPKSAKAKSPPKRGNESKIFMVWTSKVFCSKPNHNIVHRSPPATAAMETTTPMKSAATTEAATSTETTPTRRPAGLWWFRRENI